MRRHGRSRLVCAVGVAVLASAMQQPDRIGAPHDRIVERSCVATSFAAKVTAATAGC
jgi:hypothetical protein